MMCHKILGILSVLVAVILAVLAVTLPPQNLQPVILISRFFEVMLPVLGVAALLKYLWSHSHTWGECKDYHNNNIKK